MLPGPELLANAADRERVISLSSLESSLYLP
jgi:hypothetical protein